MDTAEQAEKYLKGVGDVIPRLPIETIDRIVNLLVGVYDRGNTVFTMGNGGHGATASHFINDLLKHTIVSDAKTEVTVHGKRFKAMCLCDSMPTLTTWANDVGYDACFSEQLLNWVKEGDVVVGFTASGNSGNILNAFEAGKKHKATSVCFAGAGGGKARDVADICLCVPSDYYLYVEDAHMILTHLICEVVRSVIQGRR